MARSKRRTRGRIRKKNPPQYQSKSDIFSKIRFISYKLKLLAIGLITAIILTGVWVYHPREARPLVAGIDVHTNCPTIPETRMSVQILDEEIYAISLSIINIDVSLCKKLEILSPKKLISILEIRSIGDLNSPRDFEKSRYSLPIRNITTNTFMQRVIDIDTSSLDKGPLVIELRIDGIVSDSFEKFRLIIPKSITVGDDTKETHAALINLDSILIPAVFDVLEASPEPTSRMRQLGPEISFFGGEQLSEINVLLVSRTRELWKTIYNIVALAIAMSVVAGLITTLIQRKAPH